MTSPLGKTNIQSPTKSLLDIEPQEFVFTGKK